MPDIHIIPKGEEHLHTEDINCRCKPEAHVNPDTGLLGWVHRAFLAFKNVFKI